MSSPTRAAWLVVLVLLCASAAQLAVATGGALSETPPLFALLLTAAPALAALSAALFLLRLRRDFAALAEFVREREASQAVEAAENLRVSFVASMGHDLRAPLNAIVGFADLLAMDQAAPVAGAQRQSIEIVRRSAHDLLVLLDQILDWARLEVGRIVLSPSAQQPGPLIATAIEEAVSRSADRGLRVDAAEVPEGLPPISVDRERFVEALLGLLDHATRSANAPRVTVRAGRVGEAAGQPALAIEVHDPALHIRAADQSTFFEPFRPSFAPSGRRIAGLGLGPALARALIRAHGGDVWFASDAGQGTTFHLRLPVQPGNP